MLQEVYNVLLNDISITAFMVLFKLQLYSLLISTDTDVVQLLMRHTLHACSMLTTITNRALALHKSFTSTIYAWTNTASKNFEADKLILFIPGLYLKWQYYPQKKWLLH